MWTLIPPELGIKEKVRGVDPAPAHGAVRGRRAQGSHPENLDLLIPKHIIVDDIFASINYLHCLAHGIGTDDIDHLGNRRMRCVGELLQNQFRIGFCRMERVIRERMTMQDLTTPSPRRAHQHPPRDGRHQGVLRLFPLSQFMDQTNPLAELTHKRRLSALGPGGLYVSARLRGS